MNSLVRSFFIPSMLIFFLWSEGILKGIITLLEKGVKGEKILSKFVRKGMQFELPQVREIKDAYRSKLSEFFWGNTVCLEQPTADMYARGCR
jgi:hypothetical protein